jgi:hypothetical protein
MTSIEHVYNFKNGSTLSPLPNARIHYDVIFAVLVSVPYWYAIWAVNKLFNWHEWPKSGGCGTQDLLGPGGLAS